MAQVAVGIGMGKAGVCQVAACKISVDQASLVVVESWGWGALTPLKAASAPTAITTTHSKLSMLLKICLFSFKSFCFKPMANRHPSHYLDIGVLGKSWLLNPQVGCFYIVAGVAGGRNRHSAPASSRTHSSLFTNASVCRSQDSQSRQLG